MTSTRINDSTRSHPRLRASQCGWRRRGEYWEEGGGGGAGTMIRKDRGGSMPMGTKKWTRKRKKRRRRRNLRPPYLFPFFLPPSLSRHSRHVLQFEILLLLLLLLRRRRRRRRRVGKETMPAKNALGSRKGKGRRIATALYPLLRHFFPRPPTEVG